MCWLDEILAAIKDLEKRLDDLRWMVYLEQTRPRSNLSEIIRPTFGTKLPDVKSPKDKEIDDISRSIDMANKRKKQLELAKASEQVVKKQADAQSANSKTLSKYRAKR